MVARWLVNAVAIQTTSRELATDAILYMIYAILKHIY